MIHGQERKLVAKYITGRNITLVSLCANTWELVNQKEIIDTPPPCDRHNFDKVSTRIYTLLLVNVEIKVKQEYCGNLYEVSHPNVIYVASHPAELRPRTEPEL